jgi:hypothetical protein
MNPGLNQGFGILRFGLSMVLELCGSIHLQRTSISAERVQYGLELIFLLIFFMFKIFVQYGYQCQYLNVNDQNQEKAFFEIVSMLR